MRRIDEKEVLRRAEVLSQVKPSQEATNRATERVRATLLNRGESQASLKAAMWRRIAKNRSARFAAAAVVIFAIGLLAIYRGPNRKVGRRGVSEAPKSPTEMLTAMSLKVAYRKGGMEAVERQCEQADKLLGPRPAELTVKELLAEFNGA